MNKKESLLPGPKQKSRLPGPI